jgi:hypothetical protein
MARKENTGLVGRRKRVDHPEAHIVDTKAFADAVQKLSDMLDQARQEWDAGIENGRQGMCRAFGAASEFIGIVDPKCGRKFSVFQMVLTGLLRDLERGVVGPTLKPKNVGRGRRTGFARSQLNWHAAATMASLMHESVGLSRLRARTKVADVLRKCDISNATPRSISDCYDKEKEHWYAIYAAGTNELVNDAIRRGMPALRIRDFLLKNLASIAKRWRPPLPDSV